MHIPNKFKIYKKSYHWLISFGIILLPFFYILILGQISKISATELISSLTLSLSRLFLAYFISLFLGIFLAVSLGSGKLGSFFLPIFDLLQNIPSFALIPIFALLFGYTDLMAVIFATSSILWPILFYIVNSLQTTKNDFNEAAFIFGATGFKKIIYFTIPLCFPAIITGSLVGISIGWEAVIGVEIIGSFNGIGSFLNNASLGDKNVLIFGLIALLLIVFSINKLVWMPLLKKIQLYGE